MYSENVVYSVESSCILENTLSPIARFTRFHFVYSVNKIVYSEYAKILKQNTLFSEALGRGGHRGDHECKTPIWRGAQEWLPREKYQKGGGQAGGNIR